MNRIKKENDFNSIMHLPIKSLLKFCLGIYFCSFSTLAQEESNTEKVLRSIADGVIENATFQFIDVKTGEQFSSTKDANVSSTLRPESPYTDWRYWNGVLNIAMFKLGDQLNEPRYT